MHLIERRTTWQATDALFIRKLYYVTFPVWNQVEIKKEISWKMPLK